MRISDWSSDGALPIYLLADAQRADRLGLGGVAMSRHGHASGRISSRETFNVFARERHTLMLPERVPFSIPETVIFEISILDASSAWVRPRYRRHTLSGLSPAMSLSTTDAGIRSEERRVGKDGVSTCRSRWSP